MSIEKSEQVRFGDTAEHIDEIQYIAAHNIQAGMYRTTVLRQLLPSTTTRETNEVTEADDSNKFESHHLVFITRATYPMLSLPSSFLFRAINTKGIGT
jgi:hypothetical protein